MVNKAPVLRPWAAGETGLGGVPSGPGALAVPRLLARRLNLTNRAGLVSSWLADAVRFMSAPRLPV